MDRKIKIDENFIKRRKPRGKKIIFFLAVILALVVVLVSVSIIAYSYFSTSYSGRIKLDTGAGASLATSSSFSQRLIWGVQSVGNYVSLSFDGRFGILDDFVTKFVSINITSPYNNTQIIRGNKIISGEDDLGYVPDRFNMSGRVYDESSKDGISGASCYFFMNDASIGSSSTNTSGHCILEYIHSSLSPGKYALKTNYTYSGGTAIGVENESSITVGIVQYLIPNAVANLTSGKYFDKDVAKLLFNITKTNESGTFFYDPLNVTVNATSSSNVPYRDSEYVAGYRVNKIAVGQYQSWVVANLSFNSYIKWDVFVSDDNYENYLATAVHVDTEITNCTADSSCAASTCTGSTCTDSCGNIYSGTKDCGGGVESCQNLCVLGETSFLCIDSNTVGSRICQVDFKKCLVWSPLTQTTLCPENYKCEDGQCVPTTCAPSWKCGEWTTCVRGNQTRECYDENNCPGYSPKSERRNCVSRDYENCYPYWNCSAWGECQARYSAEDVIENINVRMGSMERICTDLTKCAPNVSEYEECNLTIPIRVEMVDWCEESYLELYEKKTDKLISRIKETEMEKYEITRVDISFITTEFTGYCDYCYDGVKDFDEEEVDCGGPSCPSCVKVISFFDWVVIVIAILIISTLTLISVYIYKNREEIKKGIGEVYLTEREEKIKERKIKRAFAGIVNKISFWKRIKIRKVKEKGEEKERAEAIKRNEKWKKQAFREIRKKKKAERKEKKQRIKRIKSEIRSKKIKKLLAKIKLWKKEGYYGTAELEKDLERLRAQK